MTTVHPPTWEVRELAELEDRLACAQRLTVSANDSRLSSADDLARLVDVAERAAAAAAADPLATPCPARSDPRL